MDSIYTITLTIALVLLIISLLVIGVGLYYAENQKQYPPVKSACPDYWSAEKNGSGHSCKPPAAGHPGRGSTGCKQINTNHPSFNGPSGNCNRYKWSQRCGVTWNGHTNVANPCSDSTM